MMPSPAVSCTPAPQVTESKEKSPAPPSREIDALLDAAHRLGRAGMFPATGGNLSLRAPDGRIYVSASGRDKGRLTADDLLAVTPAGSPVDPSAPCPSAETAVHLAIYRCLPTAHAVIHTHTVAATVLGRRAGGQILLQGYEMQKAITGVTDHADALALPVLANTQDMAALAAAVEAVLARDVPGAGVLVAGHGLYAWGADVASAARHAEGWEFLLRCRLTEALLEAGA